MKMYKGIRGASLRSPIPLTNDQIRTVAPSIFSTDKSDTRGDRYTHIPTVKVLDALRGEGFQPFFVAQSKTRDANRRDFARHIIRLRRQDTIEEGDANEVILLNSHDGTSSYQMLSGVFRAVCQNGLVAGEISGDIRVPHRGNVIDNVIDASYRVVENFERVDHSREAMQAVKLTQLEQRAFARSAIELRYDREGSTQYPPEGLLKVHRMSDTANDLWTVFNVVQENLIGGGVKGIRTDDKGRRRYTTTRGVAAINENTKLNRALWSLAEEMARIKGQSIAA